MEKKTDVLSEGSTHLYEDFDGSADDGANDAVSSIKKWLSKNQVEIVVNIFFAVVIVLTALIASGVLAWGSICLGIFATLSFIGVSCCISFFIPRTPYILTSIFLLGGILLVALGSVGIVGLGLALGLGIPILVLTLRRFIPNPDNNEVRFSYLAVTCMTAAATFLILGLAGILAWSSVLAFGAPATVFAMIIVFCPRRLEFRAKIEELLEPVLFLGGMALTVLISLGILPFGAVGIGICSMLTFFSASRFLTTNSWSQNHNARIYENSATSLMCETHYKATRLTKLIFSLVGTVAGIALLVLGAVGVFGFGLGFAVGMPILSASICGVVKECLHRYDNWSKYHVKKYHIKKDDEPLSEPQENEDKPYEDKFNVRRSDNVWSVSTAISGAMVAGVSLCLGFGGVLALPVAIAVAVPLAAFSALIGLVHLFLFGLSKTDAKSFTGLKNRLKGEDDDKNKLSLLGIGFYKCEIDNERKLDDSFDSL